MPCANFGPDNLVTSRTTAAVFSTTLFNDTAEVWSRLTMVVNSPRVLASSRAIFDSFCVEFPMCCRSDSLLSVDCRDPCTCRFSPNSRVEVAPPCPRPNQPLNKSVYRTRKNPGVLETRTHRRPGGDENLLFHPSLARLCCIPSNTPLMICTSSHYPFPVPSTSPLPETSLTFFLDTRKFLN